MHLDPDDVALFFLVWTAQQFEWDFRFIKRVVFNLEQDWFDGHQLLSEHFRVNLWTLQHETVAQLLEFFNSEEKVISLEETAPESLSGETSFRKMQNATSCKKHSHDAASQQRQADSSKEDPSMQKIVFKETHITGSLEYLSPEVLERNFYSVSSDIWALGCMIYDLFYRKALFLSERAWENGQQKKMFYIKLINTFDVETCSTRKMSKAARDLFTRLMMYNPYDRLGVKDFADILEHPWIRDALPNPFVPYLPLNKNLFDSKVPNAFFIYNIFYEFNQKFKKYIHKREKEGEENPKNLLHIETVPSWNRLSNLESAEAKLVSRKPMTPLSIRLRTSKQKQFQLSLVNTSENYSSLTSKNFHSNKANLKNRSFGEKRPKQAEGESETLREPPRKKLRINPKNRIGSKRTSLHFGSNEKFRSPRGLMAKGFKGKAFQFGNPPRKNPKTDKSSRKKLKTKRLKLKKKANRYNSNDGVVGQRSKNLLGQFRRNSNDVTGKAAMSSNFKFQPKTFASKSGKNFLKLKKLKSRFQAKTSQTLKSSKLQSQETRKTGKGGLLRAKVSKAAKLMKPVKNKTSFFKNAKKPKKRDKAVRHLVNSQLYYTLLPNKNISTQSFMKNPGGFHKQKTLDVSGGTKRSDRSHEQETKFRAIKQKYLLKNAQNRSISSKNKSQDLLAFTLGPKIKLRSGVRKARALNSLGNKSFKF